MTCHVDSVMKVHAVRLVWISGAKSPPELRRSKLPSSIQLGVRRNSLCPWIQQYENDHGAREGLTQFF